MDRRGFLTAIAGVPAATFSGCVAHPDAILDMEDLSESRLADRVTVNGEVFSRDTEDDKATENLFLNGTYRRTGRWQEVDVSSPFVYDGEYYTVDLETQTVSPDVVYNLHVEYIGEANGNGTDFDALPAVDKDALSFLRTDGEYEVGYNRTVERVYGENRTESDLVPNGTVVVTDGRRFSVNAEETNRIDRERYVYTSERVASSLDVFISWLKDEYLFVLSGLSEDERTVVEQAISDGYYENSPGEAFESVARRFENHRPIDDIEEGGNYLVDYDATTYWAELRHDLNL
jgi:hypothetical protein